MAFNFIEIEKEKSRSIAVFFAAVVLFYFIGVWLACLCVFSAGASLTRGRFVIFFPQAAMTYWILAMSFLVGILHWLFSVHNLIERISAAAGARPIDREDRYHLYLSNIVGEISVAVGGRHIEPRVIPESGLNAFAIADFSGRAVIGVELGDELIVELVGEPADPGDQGRELLRVDALQRAARVQHDPAVGLERERGDAAHVRVVLEQLLHEGGF
ncbi:MAG TPA: hypothetical protein PKL03_07065, partial [Candidatus Omnitrophota bacterium]|nr:hypothetical protein [Candidatus Omnitrophota bacterium]